MKDHSTLKMIIAQVSKSLSNQIGAIGSFSVHDLIQIIKELRYISGGRMAAHQLNQLIEDPLSTKICMDLLTREYIIDGPNREIDI